MKKQYDFRHGKRGAVIADPGKERITIRLDRAILDWFRQRADAQGRGGYQTLINDALRAHIKEQRPIEEVLRKVIREELRKAG
jgi:uncharacterized protein (DUF4415 family)